MLMISSAFQKHRGVCVCVCDGIMDTTIIFHHRRNPEDTWEVWERTDMKEAEQLDFF